jgi:hypothetical protein
MALGAVLDVARHRRAATLRVESLEELHVDHHRVLAGPARASVEDNGDSTASTAVPGVNRCTRRSGRQDRPHAARSRAGIALVDVGLHPMLHARGGRHSGLPCAGHRGSRAREASLERLGRDRAGACRPVGGHRRLPCGRPGPRPAIASAGCRSHRQGTHSCRSNPLQLRKR